jgi:hypothetical protein
MSRIVHNKLVQDAVPEAIRSNLADCLTARRICPRWDNDVRPNHRENSDNVSSFVFFSINLTIGV